MTENGFPEPEDTADIPPADNAALQALPGLRRLEAALFLAREPVNARKLSLLAGLEDGTQARSLIRELNRHYDETGRAFNVQRVADGYQFRTRPSFSMWLTRLSHAPQAIRLTTPAMETLAVVAYRQPVLKADIESVRGVSCGDLLRQLLERGLIRIAGRSPELGNPYLYGTTRKFLEVFGLANLNSLPAGEKLRGSGLPAPPVSPENITETTADPLDESETSPQNLGLVNIPESTPDILLPDRIQEK